MNGPGTPRDDPRPLAWSVHLHGEPGGSSPLPRLWGERGGGEGVNARGSGAGPPTLRGSPPHPNPLPRKAGGEGDRHRLTPNDLRPFSTFLATHRHSPLSGPSRGQSPTPTPPVRKGTRHGPPHEPPGRRASGEPRVDERKRRHRVDRPRINNIPELFITEAAGQAGGTNAVQVTRLATVGPGVRPGEQRRDPDPRQRPPVPGLLPRHVPDLVVDLGAGTTSSGSSTPGSERVRRHGPDDRGQRGHGDPVGPQDQRAGERPDRGRAGQRVRAQLDYRRRPQGQPGPQDDLDINTGAGADLVEVGAVGGQFVRVKGNLIANTFKSVAEQDFDALRVNQTFVDKSIFLDTPGGGNDDPDGPGVGRGGHRPGGRGGERRGHPARRCRRPTRSSSAWRPGTITWT